MKNSLYRFVKLYIGIDYLTQVFTITEKVLKFSSSKVFLNICFTEIKNIIKFKISNDFKTDFYFRPYIRLFVW